MIEYTYKNTILKVDNIEYTIEEWFGYWNWGLREVVKKAGYSDDQILELKGIINQLYTLRRQELVSKAALENKG